LEPPQNHVLLFIIYQLGRYKENLKLWKNVMYCNSIHHEVIMNLNTHKSQSMGRGGAPP